MRYSAQNWYDATNRTICLVDWRQMASYNYVTAARKHTQIVAKYIAEFMNAHNIQAKETILVGHSLGEIRFFF